MVRLAGLAAAADARPFHQDFADVTVGAVPKGWTVAKTGAGEGSAWKVVEDKSAPKGPKVLVQYAESPGAVFNICVADDTAFRDVEVSVAFKAVEGAKDQGGGVVWRYVDSNNYYIARHNPLENNFRLYKFVDGKRTQLATTKDDLDFPAGKWLTLTVTMAGNEIVCSLNGKKYLEMKDDTFAKAGKVGVWTKADANTYFDDFQAKERNK